MMVANENSPKFGRPLGRRDMHGAAKRVDDKAVGSLLTRVTQRLRDLRIERDISPYELAAASGIHPHTILRIEGNRRAGCRHAGNIKLETLARIALALGVSPYEVIQ